MGIVTVYRQGGNHEIWKHPVEAKNHINYHVNSSIHKRIVFARVRGTLGDIMYRFKGALKLDIEKTMDVGNLHWVKYSDEVKTYPANTGSDRHTYVGLKPSFFNNKFYFIIIKVNSVINSTVALF